MVQWPGFRALDAGVRFPAGSYPPKKEFRELVGKTVVTCPIGLQRETVLRSAGEWGAHIRPSRAEASWGAQVWWQTMKPRALPG